MEKILIDIMRKGDEGGSCVNGAKKLKKENWVLLDNFLRKDDNSLAKARAKSLKSHSKRSKNHMSMKQHRQCGSFNFPKEFHKLASYCHICLVMYIIYVFSCSYQIVIVGFV